MRSGTGERGSWTSQEVYERINLLLDQLASEDLTSLPAESMGDDQIAIHRITNRVQAESLRRLHRFDSGVGYAASGARTVKSWLRSRCNLSDGAASEQVTISRRMVTLPQTAKAIADGDISFRHVSLIAETGASLGEKFEPLAEKILVDVSKEVDPRRLTVGGQHL